MENLKIGFVGLGRMGLALAKRAAKKYEVFGYDVHSPDSSELNDHNITLQSSLESLVANVDVCWLMLPHDRVDAVLNEILSVASKKLIIIDGGNSFYKDSLRRAHYVLEQGSIFIDCGTSGGVHGESLGYCLMVGGPDQEVKKCTDLFNQLAAENGFLHVGPAGAGHFVKMIHNGIEYGLLQAYAEGFHLLKANKQYQHLDLAAIAHLWNHGSIIRSWICSLSADVLHKDQSLELVSGRIGENSTGKWTQDEAKTLNVDVPVLDAALKVRADSRLSGGNFTTKLVALLRNAFGGHPLGGK